MSTHAASAGAVPIPRTSLVGRETERVSAHALLLDEAVPLLTLTGPGGVGKTRLALVIGQDVAAAFADGVTFVDLAPLTDATLVPSAVAHALGLTEVGDGSLTEQLVATLRPQQHLLILDNCEHLVEASAGLMATLLASCPALQVLATSRTALHVRGERAIPVAPLALPASKPSLVSLVEPGPAVALFVERAHAVDPQFVLDAANVGDVAQICTRLDGLPLAIELAAAWTRVVPPAALLRRLDERQLDLTGGARDLPLRQQTLRDVIAWSYDLLPPFEQQLFRVLAVFTGGFDLAATEALNASVGGASGDVFAGIAALLNQSLLERVSALPSGEPRFRMLETIRAFVWEQLVVHDEETTGKAAHAAYFLAFAETANAQVRGPKQVQWLDALEADHDNLRAALAWSLDGQHSEVALRFGSAMALFWRRRGHIAEGLDWLERALHHGTRVVSTERAEALEAASSLARRSGQLSRAEVMVNEAVRIRRELGNECGIARSLGFQASISQTKGDFDRAIALYEESLALTHASELSSEVSDNLSALGLLLALPGKRPDDAIKLLEKSLAYFREVGDLGGIAGVLSNLGTISTFRPGASTTAASQFDEALVHFRTIDDAVSIGQICVSLAELSFRHADLDRARTLLIEAIALFHTTGALAHEVEARRELGRVAYARTDFTEALQVFNEVLAQDQALGDPFGLISSHGFLGNVHRALGDLVRAEAHLRICLEMCQKQDDPFGIAATLCKLGMVARDRGDVKLALALALEALATYGKLDDREEYIEPVEHLASIMARDHQAEHAARLLGAAQALREAIGSVPKPMDQADHEQTWTLLHAQFDAESLACALAAGATSPLDATIFRALQVMPAQVRAAIISPILTASSASDYQVPSPIQRFGITEREYAVLQLLCQRLTNKEIAEQLYIGTRTVQTHTISIFTKLGVENRRDAAALALRYGLA